MDTDTNLTIDRNEIADVVNNFVSSLSPNNYNEYYFLPHELREVLKSLNIKYSPLGGYNKVPISKIIYEDAIDFLTGSGWKQDHELRYGKREYFVKVNIQP